MNLANRTSNATTRDPARRLLIVGASARAAAASARRAGFIPLAIDRFGDVDLLEMCERTCRYEDLSDLPRLAGDFPACDWIYTGPLENHPRLLRTLADSHRLLGNPADVAKRVRDPWRLAAEVRATGLNAPDVLPRGTLPTSGHWLSKPLRSGGGCGIFEWEVEETGADLIAGRHHFQRRIHGTPCSAVYIAANGDAILAGATEQLVGPKWGAPAEYQYAGSIGPLPLNDESTEQLVGLGVMLAERFHLCGLIGLDFILVGNEVWPIEVNPRYTASVEVIERFASASLLNSHVVACRENKLVFDSHSPTTISGKIIVYALCDFVASQEKLSDAHAFFTGWGSQMADLPPPDTPFKRGDPICTLISDCPSVEAMKAELECAREMSHLILGFKREVGRKQR